jgi:two-component system sensor histidine kinase/response regulator
MPMPKEKKKTKMFQAEMEIVNKTQKICRNKRISKETLMKEYAFLSEKYHKLVKELTKITRVGDVHYKKLMEANDQIQYHKSILEDLNRQLLEANAAKDKFYSIIAHDLRNPLHFLLFSSDMMSSEFARMGEESVKQFIKKVNKTAQDMSDLLESLLRWGQSQLGTIECRPRELDLYLLANECIDDYSPSGEKKNIILGSQIPPGTRVFADENMIKSVLRNLVSNAIKFTRPGGRVNLFTREEGNFIVTSVQDTGVGIPDEKLDVLFNVNIHYSTTGTAKEKGSSLGLIICSEFVRLNGGEIRVKSEVDKGSTFEFSLPKRANLS